MNDKTYAKKFQFGKVDYNLTGRRSYLVELEMELKINENKPVFTVCGQIWNVGHTDIVTGGQCVDNIYNKFKGQLKNRETYETIMALWKRWHLNDMKAGCIHQDGWKTEAMISIYTFSLKTDIMSRQNEIKDRATDNLVKTGKASISEEESKILGLQYHLEQVVISSLPANMEEYYEPSRSTIYPFKRETAAGWLRYKEHPEHGLLGRPCEVCGYKYGHGWTYRAIDKKDLAEIIRLLEIPQTEHEELLMAGK